MYSNCGYIPYRFHIPDLPEQFFFCKYPVGILCQKSKKVKFLGSKGGFFPIDPYSPGRLVNLDPTDLDHIILLDIRSYQTIVSFHMSFYPGNQFTGAEWLGHVIICSKSKSSYLVNIILLGRNHDDRDILLLAHLPANIKAIHLRKHKIQNDQIKFLCQCPIKSCISPVGYLYFKPGKFQIILFQICNCFFIFYDQYLTHFIGTS